MYPTSHHPSTSYPTSHHPSTTYPTSHHLSTSYHTSQPSLHKLSYQSTVPPPAILRANHIWVNYKINHFTFSHPTLKYPIRRPPLYQLAHHSTIPSPAILLVNLPFNHLSISQLSQNQLLCQPNIPSPAIKPVNHPVTSIHISHSYVSLPAIISFNHSCTSYKSVSRAYTLYKYKLFCISINHPSPSCHKSHPFTSHFTGFVFFVVSCSSDKYVKWKSGSITVTDVYQQVVFRKKLLTTWTDGREAILYVTINGRVTTF